MASRSCNSALTILSRRAQSPAQQCCTRIVARRLYHPSTTLRSSNPTPPSSQDAAAAAPKQTPTSPSAAIKQSPPPSTTQMQKMLLKSMRGATVDKYIVYGATERLCDALCRLAAYKINPKLRKEGKVPETEEGEQVGVAPEGGVWFTEYGLNPTFSSWAQVTMLHMWMVVARLRGCSPDVFKAWESQLVDHFFHRAEERMGGEHEITSGMIRQRYLKDLFVQWRGLIMAYDEGLAKGDAVLASAVWRNLYKGREDVDVRALAGVVALVRGWLSQVDKLEDGQFLGWLESLGQENAAELERRAKDALGKVDLP